MIAITLRQILDASPCYDPREKGLLPPNHDLDAPITFREIAGAIDDDDVVWCFTRLPGHDNLKRHFAVDCIDRVRHLMTDKRSLNALAVARQYAEGEATNEELKSAIAAARAAARAAAKASARDIAMAAVMAAAGDIAWAAAFAAAWAAAWAAELAWQAQRIIELTETGRWEMSEELL